MLTTLTFATVLSIIAYIILDNYGISLLKIIKRKDKKPFKRKTDNAIKSWKKKFLKELEEKIDIEKLRIETGYLSKNEITYFFGKYKIGVDTSDISHINRGFIIHDYIKDYWVGTHIYFRNDGKNDDYEYVPIELDKKFGQEVCAVISRKQLKKLEKENKEEEIKRYYDFMRVYDDMMFDFEGIEIKKDEFKETFEDAEKLKDLMLEAEKIHSKYKL